MSKIKNIFNNYLYKPLVVSHGNEKRVILIYEFDTTTSDFLSEKGKPASRITNVVKILDLTSTIQASQPVLDVIVVEDTKKFTANTVVLPPEEAKEIIQQCSGVILGELNFITSQMQDLSKVMITLNVASNTHDKGNLVLLHGQDNLANIVFQTVDGKLAELSREEIDKIGSTIAEVVREHISMDTTDQEELRKLKAEIEFKVVETLPNRMKASDISINIDPIINQINQFKNNEGDSDNEL